MEDKYPKVSIMIPTYGQQDYILEAVESALSQNYKNLEVIVSDDNSPDNTKKIVNKLKDSRLIYQKNKTNLGRVANYHNTVHNVASGKWAINLDGDDYYTSQTFIQDAIDTILKISDQKIIAYCYNHSNLDKIKKTIPFKEIDSNRIIVKGADYFLNYHSIGRFGHMNTLYRRDIGTQIGLYTIPYQASDFHALIRLFILGDIILDRRKVGHWRIHLNNTSIKEVDDKQRQAMLTFDAIEEFASEYFTQKEISSWREKMNISSYEDYIRTYLSHNRNLKGLALLLSNPKLKRWYFRCWFRLLFGK